MYFLRQLYHVSLEESVLSQVSPVQGVLEGLVVLVHQGVQGVLHLQGALHHQGVLLGILLFQGSSISIGVPSSGRLSIWVSSPIGWFSILTRITPSFRGSLISIWSFIDILSLLLSSGYSLLCNMEAP